MLPSLKTDGDKPEARVATGTDGQLISKDFAVFLPCSGDVSCRNLSHPDVMTDSDAPILTMGSTLEMSPSDASCRPESYAVRKRRRPDSNRGIKVLQTSALPLGYGAAVQVASTIPRHCGNSTDQDQEGENSTLTLWPGGGKVCPDRESFCPCLSPPSALRDEPAHRYNRCTSPARWIPYDTQMRYRRQIRLRLPRVQALLNLQTVNAQKNLATDFKSSLDRMIRPILDTKRRARFYEI